MKDTIECPVCHGIVNPDNPTIYHQHGIMNDEQRPTPLTDALLAARRNLPDTEPMTWNADDVAALLKRARQLERELNEAREEIKIAVTRGKMEALAYTPEEKERYGKWATEGELYTEKNKQLHQWRDVAEKLANHLRQYTPNIYTFNTGVSLKAIHQDLYAFNQLKEQERK